MYVQKEHRMLALSMYERIDRPITKANIVRKDFFKEKVTIKFIIILIFFRLYG